MRWLPALLAVLGVGAWALPVPPQPSRWTILPSSRFEVRTGKAGLLGAFGHRHTIRAGRVSGTIAHDSDRIAASSVHIEIPTESLAVVREGADREDAPEVEEAMFSDVLPPGRFPRIAFDSRIVTRNGDRLHVVGDLTLGPRTRTVAVDVRLDAAGDTLRASGSFPLRQTDFGIEPYSAAGGTIKVADRVEIAFEALAVRSPGAGR